MDYLFTLDGLTLHVPFTGSRLNVPAPWSSVIAFGSIAVYLTLVRVVFPALRPKNVDKFATSHYGALCAYSAVAFGAALYHVIQAHELGNWHEFMCTPVPGWLRLVSISYVADFLRFRYFCRPGSTCRSGAISWFSEQPHAVA